LEDKPAPFKFLIEIIPMLVQNSGLNNFKPIALTPEFSYSSIAFCSGGFEVEVKVTVVFLICLQRSCSVLEQLL
jgi:hypothetical protein